jgi:hydroxyacylglutathione hydrolase
MFLRQLYDSALAQASYVIGCQATGEALVVDPLRDPRPYLELARAEGLRITHVTETHIHADYLSGSRELCAATGAQLYLSAEGGAEWQYAFAKADGATLVRDGDRIVVGNLHFDVLHTPGHTPEHIAFVVTDTPRAAGPMGILTGDFVFVGDVGRPDLLERAAHVANTMEASARALFASLARFRALPDHLQVWPGHGAGSACGKALGAVPSSTVGYEKVANWGVAETNEEAFVAAVLDGQPEPPRYFAEMKRLNRDGPPLLGERTALPLLEATAVLQTLQHAQQLAWIIDLRPAADYATGFVPGTINVPVSKSFSTWVGSLVPIGATVVLLTADGDAGREVAERARDQLRQIGFDGIQGWLPAASLAAAWHSSGMHSGTYGSELGTIAQVNAAALASQQASTPVPVIDVRGATEWAAGHLAGARHIPLGSLPEQTAELTTHEAVVMQCQSGARSAIASSVLARAAFFAGSNLRVLNLSGGFVAWRGAALPVVSGE